jgi:hypothetical protein
MTASELEHPSPDRLTAFGLGKLGPDDQAALEAHVSRCATCCARLRSLPEDNLATLVREALDASSAPPDLPEVGSATSPSAPPPPAIPGPLAAHPRYHIERVLGVGGMGTVFRARHRLMQRLVALKVVKPALLHRPAAVERFRREVRAAAQLVHPNIVTAFDADEAGGVHFLVMEFIEGTSLARLVAEGGPLPVALACDYVRQAALGLQHAFERGMVHRDIKPHNLMRTPGGQVKILDFGLARFLSESEPSGAAAAADTVTPDLLGEGTADTQSPDRPAPEPLTRTGALVGSPDYIAPEQLRDSHAADIRADLYSLGCTLYHLLAGRPPFRGTVSEKLEAHEREQPRPLTEVRKDVPAELAAVLNRLLAKDPARRYQTPAEVAAALAPFAAAPVRRNRWRLAAVFAVLLLAGGLVFWQAGPGAGLLTLSRGGKLVDPVTHEPAAGPVRVLAAHAAGEGAWGVAFAPDGATAVSCGADGSVRQWDIAGGKELWAWACPAKEQCLRDVAVSPDGRTALVAGYDHWVRVLDVATGKEVRRLEGHQAKVHGVCFSSDGRLALSAGGTAHDERAPDNTVRLWEVATGKEIRRLEGHTGWVRSAAFSADDRHVLSASLDGTARLWDARTGKELRRFTGHDGAVLRAVFLPDGRQALSCGADGTIRLWDVATAAELRHFAGHAGAVESVALSTDGGRALSAGHDGTVRVWDVATGAELLRAEGHVGAVQAVAFSPDGEHALSGGADGTLRLWRLPQQGKIAK